MPIAALRPIAALSLTTEQVRRLVAELDGIDVPTRTLSLWAQGIAPASVRHTGQRGRWENTRLYSLADVSRVRLVAKLRAQGLSMQQTRIALAYIGAQLPDVLKPRTRATVVVDAQGRATVLQPGHHGVDVPSGQIRLPLSEFVVSEREARKFIAA